MKEKQQSVKCTTDCPPKAGGMHIKTPSQFEITGQTHLFSFKTSESPGFSRDKGVFHKTYIITFMQVNMLYSRNKPSKNKPS